MGFLRSIVRAVAINVGHLTGLAAPVVLMLQTQREGHSMNYVDVFISHKRDDAAKVEALKRRITGWGFTCFVDADDPVLKRMKDQPDADPKALADHIRHNLRRSRCLIYAFTEASSRSRWMPWETGFFDGRWGPHQVGLYDLDEPAAGTARAVLADGSHDQLSLQEYLSIYTELKPDTLHDFLRNACSTRALMGRADVDADRFATLLAGLSRNPIDFTLGWWQYMASLQQQIGEHFAGFGMPAVHPAFLEMIEAWRQSLKSFEIAMPQGRSQSFGTMIEKVNAMHERAGDVSAR
jgi:hypothetical protein